MKVLTIKVMAALTATTAGGVALAASTGTLPNPLSRPAPAISSGLSAAAPTPVRSRAGSAADGGRATTTPGSSSTASDPSDPPASASPALFGLCRAYQVGNKVTHGKALDSPAFAPLIKAAGGPDKVEPFCRSLLASPARTGGDSRRDPNRDGNHDRYDGPDRTAPRPSLAPDR